MNSEYFVQEEIFLITVKDLQSEADRLLGRELTDTELRIAIKGIESGLSFGIDTILKVAIEEAVEK